MPASDKSVRVFVSSTFKDMHAERDHLVTVVFPELRERCERLGLEFFDVDLRWGVPEKNVDGETANAWEYCRQWIDRVEPFFICMLGQRYGWVPPAEKLKDERDRDQQAKDPRSVTEMEIRRALHHEPERRHTYFYLRSTPAPADATEFVEPPEGLALLQSLKSEIRACGRPVRDYPCEWNGGAFTNLHVFGRMVLEDLWSAVLRDERYVSRDIWYKVYGADPLADPRYTDASRTIEPELADKIVALAKPVPQDPLTAERDQMTAFAKSRLRWFQGRIAELQQLTDFIYSTDKDAPRLAVLAAVPGQGKSALMARLFQSLTTPGLFVVSHFIGATEKSSSPYALVKRLVDELDRSGITFTRHESAEGQPKEEPKLDYNSLCQRLSKYLGDYTGERRIVVLIDALNQLTDGHDLAWLPYRLGHSVRIVVSCVQDMSSPKDGPEHRVLRALDARHPAPLRVPLSGLNKDNIRIIVASYLHEHCKELDLEQVNTICAIPQAGNPLYLLVLIAELCTLGGNNMFRIVPELIASLPHERPDTVSLFTWVLERMESAEGFGKEGVHWWCLYLALGRAGMSSRELNDLLTRRFGPEAAGTARRIERGLRRYLQRRDETLDFFHDQLRQAVLNRYADDDINLQGHCEIAAYFLDIAHPTRTGSWKGDSNRALNELLHHQIKARLWDTLAATVKDIFYLEAKVRCKRAFDLPRDFAAILKSLPKNHPDYCLLGTLEEAILRELHFISRHADDFPQALFQCVWNTSVTAKNTGSVIGAENKRLGPLHALTHRWAEERAVEYPEHIWVQSLRPPPLQIGEGKRVVIRSHDPMLTLLCFAPDGSRILGAIRDNAYEWDAQTGVEQRVYIFSDSSVSCGAYHPDSSRVAIGNWAGEIRLWMTESGALCSTFLTNGQCVNSVAFITHGDLLVARTADGDIWCWHLSSGALCSHFETLEHDRSDVGIDKVLFPLPDGRSVLAPDRNSLVQVWDIYLRKKIAILRGHRWPLKSFAVSADNNYLTTASKDLIQVWDISDGIEEVRKVPAAEEYFRQCTLSGDATELAYIDPVHLKVFKMDLATGEKTASAGISGFLSFMVFDPSGSRIAAHMFDDSIEVFSLNGEITVTKETDVAGEDLFSVSPAGNYLATGDLRGKIRLWDLRTLAPTGAEFDLGIGVKQLVWSADGKMLGAGGSNPQFFTFGIRGRNEEWMSDFPSMAHASILATTDSIVKIWNVESTQVAGELNFNNREICAIALAPNGSQVAIAFDDSTLSIFNLDLSTAFGTRDILHSFTIEHCRTRLWNLVYSPDGSLLAGGAGYFSATEFAHVFVWYVGEGAAERQLRHACREAVAGEDSGDVGFGLLMHDFTGRRFLTNYLCFSMDGKYLAGGSGWEPGQCWNLETGQCEIQSERAVDPANLLLGEAKLPYEVVAEGSECVVCDSVTGKRLAWLPLGIKDGQLVTATPSSQQWAVVSNRWLQLLTIKKAMELDE